MDPLRLTIFLSSPGDVLEERAAARDVIAQLSKSHLLSGRVVLEAVGWDDPDAPVSMPANLTPQQAVIRGMMKPSDCDIVVVVFGSRMDTPLSPEEGLNAGGQPYLSGTEWEFEDAVNAESQRDKPTVLLYRRARLNLNASDPDDPKFQNELSQRREVNRFFDEQRKKRRFFVEFADISEFTSRLRNDLEDSVNRVVSRDNASLRASSGEPAPISGQSICPLSELQDAYRYRMA
jgi:hypothetical protein